MLDAWLTIFLSLWYVCFSVILVVIVIFLVLKLLLRERLELFRLQQVALSDFMNSLLKRMRRHGWRAKKNVSRKRVSVGKTFVATNIYFKKMPDGSYNVTYEAATTPVTFVMIIILLILGVIFGLVIWALMNKSSNEFSRNEVYPVIWQLARERAWEAHIRT